MNRKFKRLLLMFLDSIVIIISQVISYVFLYPLVSIPKRTFFLHLFLVVSTYLILGLFTKVFIKINRFTSIRETVIHVILITFSFLVSGFIYQTLGTGISFRYGTFAYLISVIILPTSRLVWRVWIEYTHKITTTSNLKGTPSVRTLLIGAGEAGAMYVRSIRNRVDTNIVGFLDDSPNKQGTTLYGYPVVGKISDLENIVNQYNIEQVTIAIPSLSNFEITKIVEITRRLEIKTNKMPYIEDIISGKYKIDEFKDIDVTDLLGRDEVKLDTESIGNQLAHKTILVTGAGGSIGSEICRQIIKFSPRRVVLVGHGEYSIYKIEKELRSVSNRVFDIEPVIADIQDRDRIFEVMNKYKPDIVYHTAAHKHVPLMEQNPKEAVKNNIYGTKNIAEASKNANVNSFVMVSTDKAVNPPNVMGATKRIAEMIVMGLNEENNTKFTAVRFGNVLNSSGSVIPIFKEQIKNGGPVTITDFRMTRYFMTIPEASRLVLQAGTLANGGEIFVLDMGEPVKILELAKQMIWLSGHTEQEIGIIESGIRPGEKLYEELLASDENTEKKVFDKIFVGKVHNLPLELVLTFIESLNEYSNNELKRTLISFANSTYDENIKRFNEN